MDSSKYSLESVNADINEIFNREIAKELLMEENLTISEEEIDKIWKLCNGNPFDAPAMYLLLKHQEGKNV